MLIWINGAFGAGKSKVAREILGRRPAARLFDPEQIGFLLRRLLPNACGEDFQDLALWRELTVRLVAEAAAGTASPLVVPMTLVDRGHFDEIVGGLRHGGVQPHHFTLAAPASTIRRRLWRRPDWPASRRWALARVDACVEALADPAFAVHVDAEHRRPGELAEQILAAVESAQRRAA
jgi:hypothetical protein